MITPGRSLDVMQGDRQMPQTKPTAEARRYAGLIAPVHLGAGAEETLRLANSLAQTLSCRLIGVAARDIDLPYYGDGTVMTNALLAENARAAVMEELARAEGLFRRTVEGNLDVEWRSAIQEPRGFALTQARIADLMVLARQGPQDLRQGRMGLSPDDVLMDLGRPVLVVPPGVVALSAKSVVIAWKDTREARRVLWDALPLLGRAELVTVLAVGAGAEEQGTRDVCDYLAQHGISARAVLRPDSVKYIVDEIIELAQDEGADLIVAGAYGHSRLREWVLGGVTRDLLEMTPFCCLMAH